MHLLKILSRYKTFKHRKLTCEKENLFILVKKKVTDRKKSGNFRYKLFPLHHYEKLHGWKKSNVQPLLLKIKYEKLRKLEKAKQNKQKKSLLTKNKRKRKKKEKRQKP